jgi:hypothetical protein
MVTLGPKEAKRLPGVGRWRGAAPTLPLRDEGYGEAMSSSP